MSSLVTPVNGDVVTVHVIKHLKSNPRLVWSNTYDFKIGDATSGTLFTDMWTKTLAFETLNTLNTVHFTEVRISTFLPDSKPYNPEAFMTFEVDQDGANGATSDTLPIGYAWFMTRACPTGRPGKLFLRGWGTEGSVISAGGFPAFSDPGAQTAQLATTLTSSALGQHFSGGLSESVMVVAHYNKLTHVTTTREITNFVSNAPILAKISHARKHHAFVITG